MKKSIASFVGIALLSLRAFAADWSGVASNVAKSVVYIENAQGSCTGFVINAEAKGKSKEDVDWILTANHCDGEGMYAGGSAAKVIAKDTKKDLLVIEVEDTGKPALVLAKEDPKLGEEVASYGFGYGLERPMLRVTHVSDDKTYIPFEGIGGPLFAVDSTFVPGQSGGPVVNANGEVVMIVQMGTASVGLGVGAEVIKDKVGRFFGKAGKP